MSENVEFITISDLPDKECDNQNSLVSLICFTLHVASLGTALPDEFGNFSRFLSFLCLTTHSIFAPAPTSPTVRQCNTGRVKKHSCSHQFSIVQDRITMATLEATCWPRLLFQKASRFDSEHEQAARHPDPFSLSRNSYHRRA